MLEVFLLRSWASREPLVSRVKIAKVDITKVLVDKPSSPSFFPGSENWPLKQQTTPKAAQGDSSDLDYTVKVRRDPPSKNMLVQSGLGYRIIFKFQEVEGTSNRTAAIRIAELGPESSEIVNSIDLDQDVCTELLEHDKHVRKLIKAVPSCKFLVLDLKHNLVTISVDDKEILSVPRYGTFKTPDESLSSKLTKYVPGAFARLSDTQKNGTWTHLNKVLGSYFDDLKSLSSAENPSLDLLKQELALSLVALINTYEQLAAKLGERTDEKSKGRLQELKESAISNSKEMLRMLQPCYVELIEKVALSFKGQSMATKSLKSKSRDQLLSQYALEEDFYVISWSFLHEIIISAISQIGLQETHGAKRSRLKPPMDNTEYRKTQIQIISDDLKIQLTDLFVKLTGTSKNVELTNLNSQYVLAHGLKNGKNLLMDFPKFLSDCQQNLDQDLVCKLLAPLPEEFNILQPVDVSELSATKNNAALNATPPEVIYSERFVLMTEIVNPWGIARFYRNPESHPFNRRVCCLRFSTQIGKMEWHTRDILAKSVHGTKDSFSHKWNDSRKCVVAIAICKLTKSVTWLGLEFNTKGVTIAEKHCDRFGLQDGSQSRAELVNKWICKRNRMFSILCEHYSATVLVHCLFRGQFVLVKRLTDWSIGGQRVLTPLKIEELNFRGLHTDIIFTLDHHCKEKGQRILQIFRLVPVF